MYRFALPDENEEAFAARLAQELETTILREGAHTVAAVIAEPLMGAGGVMPPPRGYFDKVRALTRKFGFLVAHLAKGNAEQSVAVVKLLLLLRQSCERRRYRAP